MLSVTNSGNAGSDRFMMCIPEENMARAGLIHVRFIRSNGTALESDVLKRMVIREQDCSTGKILKISDDYRIGFGPKDMLVGLYMFPQAWKNNTLCFDAQKLGKIEQQLDPVTNLGRSFLLTVAQ
jgi:hypothetical protein